MKTILSLAVIGNTVSALSSCSKSAYTPPPSPPYVVDSWSITGATEIDRSDSSWYNVESGFEGGVCTFDPFTGSIYRNDYVDFFEFTKE